MNAFWRPEDPLTESEQTLIQELFSAHSKSTFRNNISSQVSVHAAVGSGSYANGIAAAIMTLGDLHAPLVQAVEFLNLIRSEPLTELPDGKIQGWGNSFIKGKKDPDWLKVDELVKEQDPELYDRIDSVTQLLHSAGRDIYPNPGCYTAAAAIILKMPAKISPYLFIAARMDAWSFLIMQNMKIQQEGGLVSSVR